MKQNTHMGINAELVGEVVEITEGGALVQLVASDVMNADDRALCHGGFTFGLADYAAMVAINDPNVVLGGADCRFLAPVTAGQTMLARASVVESKGKKRVVETTVAVEGQTVFEGKLTCFVLENHVLDG